MTTAPVGTRRRNLRSTPLAPQKQMTAIPLDYFVCPLTKEPLCLEGDTLLSPRGDRYFFRDNAYWSFMPPLDYEHHPDWRLWEALQKNGEVAYPNDPEHNLGVGDRADFVDFARFCSFRGLVLDVGSGPQKIPTHFKHGQKSGVTFFGIDPLAGEQPRDYLFVQGLGEYLPFRGNLFDQVLFVTSLDHIIDPVAALVEARRVVRPDGEICIWFGEKDENAPPPKESPEWYRRLEVPRGAEDPFHLKRFDVPEFKLFVEKAGLAIARERIIEVDPYRRNAFYKLARGG